MTVPGVGISEFSPSVVNELLIYAYLTSSRSGAECEHDPLNYSQAKALSESGTIGALKLFQCAGGYGGVNLGGNLYGFAPVCLVDGDGNIYEDKLYLAYMENRQTADATALQNDGIQQQGDMETELLMIDDPDAVKEYLSFIREDIERYTKVDTLPPEDFEELRQGSSGEDVRELQEALLASGWLDDGADGSCGKKTTAAVSALQEKLGLEPAGMAGPLTLAIFYGGYGNDGGREWLLKWMDEHCPA